MTANMPHSPTIDWQQETQKYDRPHRRLLEMARWLKALPQRRLLDVGCSTTALRRLLPPDFHYYGCDITDHARQSLEPGHFRQMDFNVNCDLQAFAQESIDVIHIGGVLEYLERPPELLQDLRRLVKLGSPMVLSIINFHGKKFSDAGCHHPGWIYKPSLPEFRQVLQQHGWQIKRQAAFLDKNGPRAKLTSWWANCLGVDHPWTRRRARQFILLALAA
jgi:SAM-dependent methyltransferase